jgi:hypothetical protein|tara:strand:- start:601 stop:801 length:201 start_codon:yes stop_codon:yes gene_type:complete
MADKSKKGKWSDTAKYWTLGGGGTGLGILKALWDYGTAVPMKHGGRVTPKGIGKAKRGFGRAMRKK